VIEDARQIYGALDERASQKMHSAYRASSWVLLSSAPGVLSTRQPDEEVDDQRAGRSAPRVQPARQPRCWRR